MYEVEFSEKEKQYLDEWIEYPDTAIVYYGAVIFVVEKLKEINGWDFEPTDSTEYFTKG